MFFLQKQNFYINYLAGKRKYANFATSKHENPITSIPTPFYQMKEKKVIISLGRQFGSGGQQIGKRLAELLGIEYFDRELITEIARQSGLDPDYVARHDERAPGFFDYALAGRIGPTSLYGSSQSFVVLTETLKKLAKQKSCLIVGRTADYILRDEPHLVTLFVHAPYKYRVRYICKERNITPEEADKLITKYDRERARFYDFFTDKTWGQSDSYELSVDVSKLGGQEQTAQFLADYVRQRMERFE